MKTEAIVNHVAHVAWISAPENLAANARRLGDLTGVPLEGPTDLGTGMHSFMNRGAGIEIVAPISYCDTTSARHARKHLETHGEGVYAVVLTVRDLDQARERASRAGYAPDALITDRGTGSWGIGKTCHCRRLVLPDFMRIGFIFQEPDRSPDAGNDLSAATASKNVNRFDHIAFYTRPEEFEAQADRLGQLAGAPLDGPQDVQEMGIRVCLGWESGLEILSAIPGVDAPMGQQISDLLDARGDGVFSVVFGVEDMAAARQRAQQAGLDPSEPISGDSNGPWAPKTRDFAEAFLGPFMNAEFVFGDIEYSEGVLQALDREAVS